MHAALLAKYAIERWARMPVEVCVASEYRYADPIVGPDTLVIAVAQSGETADTLAATRLAREHGAPIIAVTNIVGSAITRVADAVLYLQAGPEISVTATKTFVTTTTVLYLAGLWLGRHLGALHDVELRAELAALQAIPDQMEEVIARYVLPDGAEGPLEPIAARLAASQSCLFIGRGPAYVVALEGALKLKELSYVHAEAYAAGELKHGPIALLAPETPLIAIATAGRTYEKVISNVEEVLARGAPVIAARHRWRPRDCPPRQRGDDRARRPRNVRAAAGDHPAAGAGVPRGHPARLRHRPAPQPGEIGHGGVTAWRLAHWNGPLPSWGGGPFLRYAHAKALIRNKGAQYPGVNIFGYVEHLRRIGHSHALADADSHGQLEGKSLHA